MRKPLILALVLGTFAAAACGNDTGTTGPGGTIQFTASGEVLALGGYDFAPDTMDPAFVDGWVVKFDRLIVTFDKITLSNTPDKSPTDESQTDEKVAEVDGPWAVDLHKGGPLPGKGGGNEQALAIATITGQNLKGNIPFGDTDRYAFGFDIVAATDKAMKLNLDAQGLQDYAEMVTKGWSVLYVGTATWMGGNACKATDMTYDFTKLPPVVKFRLGFKTPTTYVNCQNPDLMGKAFDKEEHQRGVQTKNNTVTIAQATVHTDHPFWESFKHDTPAHFDQLAALAKKVGNDYVVTLDETKGVNFTAFKDTNGNSLPWRACLNSYMTPDMAKVMHFDTQGIPYDPAGNPSTAIRDYYDYMTYDQSTQGHLNSNGLCYVKRQYPSPQ